MSLAPATKGPPLPARGPPLPPRNSSTLPPLPHAPRRASADPPGVRRGGVEPPSSHQRHLPPPPPRRNASLSSSEEVSEFESRYRFHPVASLPPPEPFSEGRRTYPSEMPKSTCRPEDRDSLPPPPPSQPPPPPPR